MVFSQTAVDGGSRRQRLFTNRVTYIPVAPGFIYLATVPNWFALCVLAWRVSAGPGNRAAVWNFAVAALDLAARLVSEELTYFHRRW